tara:strand:- start:219 stop:455 length:237 start_codon:yes stop_codon:yes gene_type:complete
MQTKTAKAKMLFNKGDFKRSFAIFKRFTNSLSKDETRTLEIASECLNGFDSFYRQLGFSIEKVHNDAIILIKRKFINN